MIEVTLFVGTARHSVRVAAETEAGAVSAALPVLQQWARDWSRAKRKGLMNG
jgi:hypothetical protein